MQFDLSKYQIVNIIEDIHFEMRTLVEKLQANFVFFKVHENIHFCNKITWDFIHEMTRITSIFDFGKIETHRKLLFFSLKYDAEGEIITINYNYCKLIMNVAREVKFYGDTNSVFFLSKKDSSIVKYSSRYKKRYAIDNFKAFSNEHNDIIQILISFIRLVFDEGSTWRMWREFNFAEMRMVFCPFSELFKLHTKQQIIEHIFDKKIPYNLNKLPLDWGMSLVYWFDFINEKDIQKVILAIPTLQKKFFDEVDKIVAIGYFCNESSFWIVNPKCYRKHSVIFGL